MGIADVETQKKLRADKTPNFVEAVKLPLARETLSRDMQGLAASPANGTHKVNQPRPHSTIVSAHQTQQTIAFLLQGGFQQHRPRQFAQAVCGNHGC